MNYFQEIKLLPGGEITPYFIWEKLFQQVHLAMVENKNEESLSLVGLSFPEYNADDFALGTKLRLFADKEDLLKDMQCEKWLNRLLDYVQIKPITHVPDRLMGHANFRNLKLKGNKEKLARRRVKRKGETMAQALKYFDDFNEKLSKLPYINVMSQSNGHRFRLFIDKTIKKEPQEGFFSCYGLSRTTTVPIF